VCSPVRPKYPYVRGVLMLEGHHETTVGGCLSERLAPVPEAGEVVGLDGREFETPRALKGGPAGAPGVVDRGAAALAALRSSGVPVPREPRRPLSRPTRGPYALSLPPKSLYLET
jgi:hypothetical protein